MMCSLQQILYIPFWIRSIQQSLEPVLEVLSECVLNLCLKGDTLGIRANAFVLSWPWTPSAILTL